MIVSKGVAALIYASVRGNLHKLEGVRYTRIVEHFAEFSTLQIAAEALAYDRRIWKCQGQDSKVAKYTAAIADLLVDGTGGELPEEISANIRKIIEVSQVRANYSGIAHPVLALMASVPL